MRTQPHQTHPTLSWPQVDDVGDISTGAYEQDSYLDEDTVTIVLMQAILRLSAESRRKLLMIVHQAEDAAYVAAELRTEPEGRLELRLTYQDR